MSNIQPKRKTVIQKGTTLAYNKDNFTSEANFYEANTAEEILTKLQPFTIDNRRFITFDTETHKLDLKNHDIPSNLVRRWVGSGKTASPQDLPFCISICDGINCFTIYDTLDNNFAEFKALAPIFEDPTIEKIAHNAKYDMHMFANIGMKIVGKIHDTVVLAKLANENRHSFALMDLAAKIKTGNVKYEYMVDSYKKTYKIVDYRHLPKNLLTAYANADVWNAYVVFMHEYSKVVKDELEALYDNELALMLSLWAMERFGMAIDLSYEAPLKEELQKLTDDAEKSIYEEAGCVFNVNSGKQLYEVLMKLGVSPHFISKTDKGNPSLDKKALEELAEKHNVSIVSKILEFRKYEKLLGTYAVGIYEQRDAENKVHGSINQTEATTGRMSITKPALQTLPKKDKRIRRCFVPTEGFELWFMDLDQIEYRLFAHYAQSTGLIEAIKAGKDVHQATAAIIYNVKYDEVTEEQRTKAKTVNFSLIYGQGDDASARSLKMTISEARMFKNNYFAQIPEAGPFIHTVQNVTRTRGYIRNFYGRRRRLTYDEAYKAPNALIQGCAADYIKHKLVDIYKFLLAGNYKTRMVNVVHDEVVFEIHKDEKHLVPTLRWLLSDFEAFRVPITAGVEYGNPSWGQKEEPTDVGFAEVLELTTVRKLDVFDGSVFDVVKKKI